MIIVFIWVAVGVYEDRTGSVIVDWFVICGYDVAVFVVVSDGIGVVDAFLMVFEEEVHFILIFGGIGIFLMDGIVDAIVVIVDY
ncbi:MAG: hypothetical protein O7C59_03685 [Rickettsia endosymbiont of Ixodes persulcatus]|nr:hypothetical protein [Rickettsia endosymbiont of Ixodes persulcatus]